MPGFRLFDGPLPDRPPFELSVATGAVVSFDGRVRDHNQGRSVSKLAYSAYPALALSEGDRIVSEAVARFTLNAAACCHRLGDLDLGDVAVRVWATAGHRAAAFDGCRYILDEVKARVPIWKKETYLDGECEWVMCTHPSTDAKTLTGVTIALPETRESARMAGLLEAAGATTLRCPLVALVDPPDWGPVDAWLKQFAQTGFDDLILLTGEGLRRLLARARAQGIGDAFLAALKQTRKITRGGKPARVLHELGLAPDIAVSPPTSQGVVETLRPLELRQRRIGVQLYGTEPNEPLVGFLRHAGAIVATVAPYAHAPASDAGKVQGLIAALAAGTVDVIAFTTASQVERLWQVARAGRMEDELQAGLARSRVAAMGPIVAEALGAGGVRVDIVPEGHFVMKRLTDAIAAALSRRTR
jgi:uroporphyrinogen-III synthase